MKPLVGRFYYWVLDGVRHESLQHIARRADTFVVRESKKRRTDDRRWWQFWRWNESFTLYKVLYSYPSGNGESFEKYEDAKKYFDTL